MSRIHFLRLIIKLPYYAEFRKAKLEKAYTVMAIRVSIYPTEENVNTLLRICRKALWYERNLCESNLEVETSD